jgi:hypothetical protein
MRTLEFTAEGETYRAVIRQGLATVQDCSGRLVRVHRIDGGRPQPSPDDVIMARLVSTIKETKGGSEYLEACASVRVARDNALADPGSKWRDYEMAWLEGREIRESWEVEDGGRMSQEPPPSLRASQNPQGPLSKLPRASIRRRMVAWGQR